MPSKSPRINVVVTEEQHAMLLELGQLQGRSAASYLRQSLDHITPSLVALLDLLRSAKQQTQEQLAELQKTLDTLAQDADAQRDQLDLLKLLAAATQPANDPVEGPERTERSEGEPAPSRASRKR